MANQWPMAIQWLANGQSPESKKSKKIVKNNRKLEKIKKMQEN